MKQVEYNNIIYKIGQNANENWILLDENNYNPKYIWFHLNSFPSCYVVLCNTLEDVNEVEYQDFILYGANLCKQNTKYRYYTNLKIIYTTLDKITKTNKIGEVIIKGKKKIITI